MRHVQGDSENKQRWGVVAQPNMPGSAALTRALGGLQNPQPALPKPPPSLESALQLQLMARSAPVHRYPMIDQVRVDKK